MESKYSNGYYCPECKSNDPDVVEDFSSGDVICRGCGLVLSEKLVDEHSEWRTFSNNDDDKGESKKRAGGASNPLLSDGGLTTSISRGEGASSSANNLNRINNKVALDSADKSLMSAFKEIQRMAERISLPQSIIDRAFELFKGIDDIKTMRGRHNDGVIAASLYISCRVESVPRTFKEICDLTQVSKKELSRAYKYMTKHLKDKKFENLETITATDFISRFCNQLELPSDVIKASIFVCNEAMRLGIMAGKSPISVAAAGIYMVSQLSTTKRTQKAIADVTGVSEITIKSAYKDLHPRRTELLPADSEFQKNIHNLPTN